MPEHATLYNLRALPYKLDLRKDIKKKSLDIHLVERKHKFIPGNHQMITQAERDGISPVSMCYGLTSTVRRG